MNKYQRIIAAVDFSEHTDAVLQRALRLAQQNDAQLIVAHIVDYAWPLDADYVISPVDEIEAGLIDKALKRLDELLNDAGAQQAEKRVVAGRPKQEIVNLAEKEQADLIVVGAHGHHGLPGFLGSTTDQIIHRATCEVLTVR